MHSRSSKLGFWAAFTGLALSLAVVPAHADPPKKPVKEAKDKTPAEAPQTANPIPLVPEGLKWGMSRTDLEKLVDKFIDADHKNDYKAAGSSGSKIKDLDAKVSRMKNAFKQSWNELVVGPTGLDSSPMANEFSKGNNEALMSHHRGPGVKIWFFFINGRLWKTYEEISFVKGGLYGENMGEATAKLLAQVGDTVPRQVPANPDKGNFYDVFDWADKETHMRVWDRSGILALVREERSTANGIAGMRTNKGAGKDAMDPQVAAILRGGDDKKDDKIDKKDEKKKK